MNQIGQHERAVITVQVEQGRTVEVRIAGDFTVEPQTQTAWVLEQIALALVGLPVDLPHAAFAARVQAAIPFPIELIGTNAEAIASAMVNALRASPSVRIGTFSLGDVSRLSAHWREWNWQIIHDVPRTPAMNVALDDVLCEAVAQGLRSPTLRFWNWLHPAVILGRCQSVLNEVDVAEAQARGVHIVRRFSGGGAMFVQPKRTITYSLVMPERAVEGLNIRQSYELCDAWAITALRACGLDAHHVPINDVACAAGKIGGAAQARKRGVVLHHTTMAYALDMNEMLAVLRLGRMKLKEKGIASAAKRVAPIASQTHLSRDEILQALQATFQSSYGGQLVQLNAEDVDRGEVLVEAKYGTAAWTHEYE